MIPTPSRQWIRDMVRDMLLGVAIVVACNVAIVALVYGTADRAGIAAFFAWPSGSVWSNLIASAILGAFTLYVIARRAARNHAERLALAREHHEEHLALAREHHAEILTHLTRPGTHPNVEGAPEQR